MDLKVNYLAVNRNKMIKGFRKLQKNFWVTIKWNNVFIKYLQKERKKTKCRGLLQRNNGHELYKSENVTRKMNVRSSQNRSRVNPEGSMEKPLKSDRQTLKQGTPKSPRRQGMCPHKGLSEQWGLSSEATEEVRRNQRTHSRCWKRTIEVANKKNTEADKAVLYKRTIWNASFKSVINNIFKNNVYA